MLNSVQRALLDFGAKRGCMGAVVYSDGLSIKEPRVPRTLRTLKLFLLLNLQNTHLSIVIILVLFLLLVLLLFMLIPFCLNIGLILSLCFPKASGLTGNIICVYGRFDCISLFQQINQKKYLSKVSDAP